MELVMFIPNIEVILYQLERSPESYPKNIRAYDWAFGDFAAIPCCYRFVIGQGDIPGVAETANHLVKSRWPDFAQKSNSDKAAIRNRGLKLVMDFYRDLHALALLGQKFGSVKYEKGLDLGYNVDYTVKPKPWLFTTCPRAKEVNMGIAAAMMLDKNWRNPENDITKKMQRRERRGFKPWDGEVFWLTNRTRPFWKSVKGVWLFGMDHVNDLIEDIRAKYSDDSDSESGNLGIIQLPLFD